MNHVTSILFFCFVLLCSVFELCMHNFSQSITIQLLLSLYTLLIFENQSKLKVGFALWALLAKDFIMHGLFGLPLLYLAPLTLGAVQIKKRLFYPTSLFHYLFISLAIIGQLYLVEGAIFGYFAPVSYAFYSICATIIVMFFLLKYRFKGEQDNRL